MPHTFLHLYLFELALSYLNSLIKIKPLLRDNRCTLIGVSQLRQQVGAYGDPNQPTGGLAWKFYSDIRYKVSKVLEKENESNKTTVEVIKNKCAAPWGVAKFSVNWGTGVDRWQEIVDLAVEYRILSKTAKGGWYTVGGDGTEGSGTKVQGDEALKVFLSDNEAYATSLEKEVLYRMQNGIPEAINPTVINEEDVLVKE